MCPRDGRLLLLPQAATAKRMRMASRTANFFKGLVSGLDWALPNTRKPTGRAGRTAGSRSGFRALFARGKQVALANPAFVVWGRIEPGRDRAARRGPRVRTPSRRAGEVR